RSQTATVCSVSGNQVTTLTVGTCTIAADQSGDVGYWLPAATVTSSFQVTGMPQSITFNAIGSLTVGATTTLVATASSHLTVSFSSQTPSVCTVSGTVLTVIATGTCTVAADQAGDGAFWLPAPTVTQSVAITSGGGSTAQSVTFPALPD